MTDTNWDYERLPIGPMKHNIKVTKYEPNWHVSTDLHHWEFSGISDCADDYIFAKRRYMIEHPDKFEKKETIEPQQKTKETNIHDSIAAICAAIEKEDNFSVKSNLTRSLHRLADKLFYEENEK